MEEEEAMDSREAMKALTAIRMARDHAVAGRHGPATALLMQVPIMQRPRRQYSTNCTALTGDRQQCRGKDFENASAGTATPTLVQSVFCPRAG